MPSGRSPRDGTPGQLPLYARFDRCLGCYPTVDIHADSRFFAVEQVRAVCVLATLMEEYSASAQQPVYTGGMHRTGRRLSHSTRR